MDETAAPRNRQAPITPRQLLEYSSVLRQREDRKHTQTYSDTRIKKLLVRSCRESKRRRLWMLKAHWFINFYLNDVASFESCFCFFSLDIVLPLRREEQVREYRTYLCCQGEVTDTRNFVARASKSTAYDTYRGTEGHARGVAPSPTLARTLSCLACSSAFFLASASSSSALSALRLATYFSRFMVNQNNG